MKQLSATAPKKARGLDLRTHWRKHLMMLPVLVILGLFCYYPMAGILMAFQNYLPGKGYFGSKWVGMQWFEYMFSMPNFKQVVWNTLYLSLLKLVTGIGCSVILALLLNEMQIKWLKSLIQSCALFPFFVSWVVLADIVKDMASSEGLINQVIFAITGDTIPFLTDTKWFTVLLVVSNIWKEVGYNAIILLASLAAIDPTLYEAATIDGAGRFQRIRYITIPGIRNMIMVLVILALGGVMSAGFDQVFNLYNTTVMSGADIIDTYVYRMGVNGGLYSLGTAVGLFKSVVGAILLMLSYKAADKWAGYRIF